MFTLKQKRSWAPVLGASFFALKWLFLMLLVQRNILGVAGVQCKPNVPFTVKEPHTSKRIDISPVSRQSCKALQTCASCTCVCVRVMVLKLSQKPWRMLHFWMNVTFLGWVLHFWVNVTFLGWMLHFWGECCIFGSMLHFWGECYIFGVSVTFLGWMLHFWGECCIFGVNVTFLGWMLYFWVNVTFLGWMLHFWGKCCIFGSMLCYIFGWMVYFWVSVAFFSCASAKAEHSLFSLSCMCVCM